MASKPAKEEYVEQLAEQLQGEPKVRVLHLVGTGGEYSPSSLQQVLRELLRDTYSEPLLLPFLRGSYSASSSLQQPLRMRAQGTPMALSGADVPEEIVSALRHAYRQWKETPTAPDVSTREIGLLRQEMIALRREQEKSRQEMHDLRSVLSQLIQALQESSHSTKDESVLTSSEQALLISFSSKALTLPDVEAVGYRNTQEGRLLVCTLLSTRELNPERAVIALWVKTEDEYPDVDMEFKTLLTPPGSIEELRRRGYSIISKS